MSQYRITSRYAKALLDLSIENKALKEVEKDVELMVGTCEESRQLVVLFKNPIVLPQKKLAILKSLFQGKVHELTYKFLEVIVRKNRSHLIFEVMEMFLTQYKTHEKIADAVLYTTSKTTDATNDAVTKMLRDATGEDVRLETVIDEDLIGGFKIRYKDRLLDASVSSKLNELKKDLLD